MSACSDAEPSWGDTDLTNQYLVHLITPCSYNASSHIMLVTVQSDETAFVTRRTDGALLVNGEACGTATATVTKRINVVENPAAAGDEAVIIDLTAGTYAPGDATGAGITLSLGSGDDQLAIRLGNMADAVVAGTTGISLNKDAFKDVTIENTGTVGYQFTLGGGDDTFSAEGSVAGTGATLTAAVTAYGNAGVDKLVGGAGNDLLAGGDGDDTIKGGLGDDTCNGDAGNDVFDESRPVGVSNGNDRYSDSAGTADKVDYSTRSSALALDIEPAGSGTNDDGELALSEADQLDTGIDILLGGSGDDALTGDDGANSLLGGAGNDTLAGGAGNDILDGSAGNDLFLEGSLANGSDTFIGGAGKDTVDYSGRSGAVKITLNGLMADDGEVSSNEADFIKVDVENCKGGAGNDDITGSTVDNVIAGGLGDDTLRGDDGNDTFAEGSDSTGGDTFIGGAGFDTVDYGARTDPVFVTMGGAAADDGKSGEHDNLQSGIESCIGGASSDVITGSAGDDLIEGGDSDDVLSGGPGNDMLYGDAGHDTLRGDADDDTLDGGDDNADILDGGPGSNICTNGESVTSCDITI